MMKRPKRVENKRCKVQRKKTRLWSRRDGDSIVYMHRNRRNGRIYIGYTTRSCFERWTYSQYKRNGRNNYFYNALMKEKKLYEEAGIQSDDIFLGFESRILVCGLSAEDAPEAEKVTIAFLRDKGVELYNRTDGGEAPPIVRLVGEDNPMKNPKIAAKIKGKNNPMKRPEVRAKMSELMKGEKNPHYGKHHSKELLQKWSKPVEAIDIETGKQVYYFASTMEAERAGFYRKSIRNCCNHKQKTHRGLIWRFAKLEPDQTE